MLSFSNKFALLHAEGAREKLLLLFGNPTALKQSALYATTLPLTGARALFPVPADVGVCLADKCGWSV